MAPRSRYSPKVNIMLYV